MSHTKDKKVSTKKTKQIKSLHSGSDSQKFFYSFMFVRIWSLQVDVILKNSFLTSNSLAIFQLVIPKKGLKIEWPLDIYRTKESIGGDDDEIKKKRSLLTKVEPCR